MYNVTAAFLYAEDTERETTRQGEATYEEKAMSLLPPEFFIRIEVDCARCHERTNLEDAKIVPRMGYRAFCPGCTI
jgi:formylmethanofuran dehydrogenase subunit E